MNQPEICKYPSCGTPHVKLWVDQGQSSDKLETNKLMPLDAARLAAVSIPPYPIDILKCKEQVSKDGWLTEQQCTRARGYGRNKAYCRQHSKLHPEEANKS